MELRFLGGHGIGRSAVLVNESLLLDFGLDSGNPPRLPVGDLDPEAVVVSHGHLDHVGAVPSLLSGRDRPPVHWTPPTRDLGLLLARDTLKLHGGSYRCPFTEAEVSRLTQVSRPHSYGETFEAAGHEVVFLSAGHIPGSAHVLVDDGDTRLLYTGDFAVDEPDRAGSTGSTADGPIPETTSGASNPYGGQRLVSGSTARPEVDVVITENTYSDVTHDARAAVEARFADRLERTVLEGGTVVVPAFAIGRTQEVMEICAAHGIDCYVDGMGTRVNDRLRATPEFLRNGEAFKRAMANARVVSGGRERIAAESTVIITTSGMLHGGPAMTYVPEIAGDPTNLIAFSGFQVPGTPGRELLETGRVEINSRVIPVSARVEAFELSAHADREGLLRFLEPYRENRILVVHGDRSPAFAGELRGQELEASAPGLGERVVV